MNVSDLSWETEDKEKIILCNNNRNSYYRDPIGGTAFIRKDYFDKYAKSHCIKYFAFAERLIPETGYADETSLHFEIKDGQIIKRYGMMVDMVVITELAIRCVIIVRMQML